MIEKKILIISPIFKPSVGGASTYYSMLVNLLTEGDAMLEITVLTEKHPNAPKRETLKDGKLKIVRKYPFRAGKGGKNIFSYLKYIYQNIQYLLLPFFIFREKFDYVLIHSSLHNYPNILQYLLPVMKKNTNIKWISDVRDWQLPEKEISQLEIYDVIIACSKHIVNHLSTNKMIKERIVEIPVLQEKIDAEKVSYSNIDLIAKNVPYICYVGLIKKDKGIDLLLASFELLKEISNVNLILVGDVKQKKYFSAINNNERVFHVSSQNRDSILTILKGSALVVNLSQSEGMPRICLEAMALNVSVLLPCGIEEFQHELPLIIACDDDPVVLASNMKKIIDEQIKSTYKFDSHYADKVLPQYKKLIFN